MFTILEIIGHEEVLGGYMDANGIAAQVTWLTPERLEACRNAGAPTLRLDAGDFINCDLLGAMPSSMTRDHFANWIPAAA